MTAYNFDSIFGSYDYSRGGFQPTSSGNYWDSLDFDWSDSWDSSWDSSFDVDTSDSWYAGIMDFANSRAGSGLIMGAAGGLANYFSQKDQEDMYGRKLAWDREALDKQLAMQEKGLAIQAGQLALQKSIFADKVQTRKKHNETINTAPNATKKVRFG